LISNRILTPKQHPSAILLHMRTVSFIHYKGGVGKTTVAALLCRVLSAAGYRVLAVDLDRCQYHLSTLLGGSPPPEYGGRRPSTAYASCVLSQLLCRTANDNLDCMTLCGSLCDPDSHDAFQLRKRFSFFKLGTQYDYILIDTPPGFGAVHELALNASDDIIVPTDLSPMSLSMVERFCAKLDGLPRLAAVRCHILRHFLVPSENTGYEYVTLQKIIKEKLYAHSLSAHARVRTATSGRPDFLKLALPRRIVSQLVAIAADLLHADRIRLENAAAGLCGPEYNESQEERPASAVHRLLDIQSAITLETDYSVTAS
jgi:cellulose biosynthesis protein BcsQ